MAMALVVICILPVASVMVARAILEFNRKEARSRLIQQRSTFVLESISSGVLATDQRGVVTYANQAVLELFGVDLHDVVGSPARVLNEGIGVGLERCGESGFRNREISLKRENWQTVLLMDVGVLREEEGNTVGHVVLLKDVTEVRNLQEKVLQAERLSAVGEMAAMAAHEIRNPLTAIRGFLQILTSKVKEEEHLRYLRLVLEEADRMNNLVRQMVAFAKPVVEPEGSVDINRLVQESILLAFPSDKPNMRLVVNLDPSIPPIRIKPQAMKQVFINLINNSVEAMADSGVLTISTEAMLQEGYIAILTKDTGCGIPLSLHDQVFQPFMTTKARGMGLGLSICHRIVQGHGGRITLASSRGRGSTFVILLPLNHIDHCAAAPHILTRKRLADQGTIPLEKEAFALDINHYRERLVSERKRLFALLEGLGTGGIRRPLKESIQELSLIDNHPADVASETFEKEKDAGLADLTRLNLDRVERALDRIDLGTYGVCVRCGTPISQDRLEALPSAELCLPCQDLLEREEALDRVPSLSRERGRRKRDADSVIYDSEDAWQDVARYGTASTPSDVPGSRRVGDAYVDAPEPRGTVQEVEGLAYEDGEVEHAKKPEEEAGEG